jgi:hypothetical protein
MLAFSTLAAGQVSAPGFSSFAAVPAGGSASATLEVYNYSSVDTVLGVQATVNMPAGFTVVSAGAPQACIASSSILPGGVGITFSIPTLGPWGGCYPDFVVAAGVTGFFNANIDYSGSNFASGTTANAKFTGYLPASAGVSFSPNPVAPGSPSTLSLTISNPDTGHWLYVDDGDGGTVEVGLGSWASATVTGTSPAGCATDDSFGGAASLLGRAKVAGGPPYLYEDGGWYLGFVAELPPGTTCTITVDVVSSTEGTFSAPPYGWDLWLWYSPMVDWTGFSREIVLSPSPLVVRTATGPIVSFTPSRLDFGAIRGGASSGPLEATLTNTGTGPLGIADIQVLGRSHFGVTHNCLASLPPDGSCAFQVTFSAVDPGPYFGEVRVSTDAAGSPHVLGLSGSVIAVPIGTLGAGPAALAFEERVIGTTSAAQAVTITNTGDAPATVSAVGTTGDFAVQSSTCAVVQPRGTCTVLVVFRPTGTGTRGGQLQVASDASNPVLTVGLTGVGVPAPAPVVSLSPGALDFGQRVIGARSVLSSTLRNAGNAELVLGAFEVTGDFTATHDCPARLAAGQGCRIDVEFTASVPGRRTGAVRFGSNAAGSPHALGLAGTGCRLAVTGRSFALDCGR